MCLNIKLKYKGMAENNAVLKRRKSMSKDTIMAAASVYQSLYGYEDGSVPATFQVCIWRNL